MYNHHLWCNRLPVQNALAVIMSLSIIHILPQMLGQVFGNKFFGRCTQVCLMTCFVHVFSGQAIRGSDSQLCPKPPPKPSKVPLARLPRSPCLQPLVLPSSSSSLTDSSSTSPRLTATPLDSTCVESPGSTWSSEGNRLPSYEFTRNVI